MKVSGTDLAIGLMLGMIGGAIHLGVTWWRASMAIRAGSAVPALLTFPLALLGPAAAVVVAAKIAPAAAWITPLGLFGARFVGLRAAGMKRDRGAGPAAGSEGASRP